MSANPHAARMRRALVAAAGQNVLVPMPAAGEFLDAHDPSIPPRPARGPVSCWSCRGEVASAAETCCLRCRAQGKVEVPRG